MSRNVTQAVKSVEMFEEDSKPVPSRKKDDELIVMGRIQRQLDALEPAAAARVVTWMEQRWSERFKPA
jgi:hypothetical protein